ncbi:DUF2737 family protein [Salmonella enterica subsp. enterica serovar Ago]|uniref:DUF2737 family protein n=1 Tax=Salmonella enterica TaxID=28901 RepID=A0A8E6RET1_SALER|nr:DUF2737 family protein [Salmonella enterica]EBB0359221.1 DUF2737 family protein [Salmonella enterica subsp. enterica serovar Rubislaw]EBW3224507.1 hypothetical protein [Salmonella enterica subsp. enterica serovar Ago]ECE0412534.1 DUF2737 family protein [Salmonella enterica subsp. enterica]EDR3714062.1 DUF2737 family protein [Salmonella enterica subsp. enterica serovar Abony]EEJ6642824.1 DUF2737 family protein [Salmonella enterica subsp. enterica serovar Aderike]
MNENKYLNAILRKDKCNR